MKNKFFLKSTTEEKYRRGLLGGKYYDCFTGWMQAQGYSRWTMRVNIRYMFQFGQYLQRRGVISIENLKRETYKEKLSAYKTHNKKMGRSNRAKGIAHLFYVLEQENLIHFFQEKDSSYFPLISRYISFLKEHGYTDSTIRNRQYYAKKFLNFLGVVNTCQKNLQFGVSEIDGFINVEAIHLKRHTKAILTGCLKNFLRFLYQIEIIPTDMSINVLNPCLYKLESTPRVLNTAEVKSILESVNRNSKLGKRDRCILEFLITYGLRAGEIANLKLDDINWREETLCIVQRKNGKPLELPLMPVVGKLLLQYLKYARPAVVHREIFLRHMAPIKPLQNGGITCCVRRYLKRAGLDHIHGGAHLFRHTFATNLCSQGVPLKHIGDLLGHKSCESTQLYTKTNIPNLCEIALEVPYLKGDKKNEC